MSNWLGFSLTPHFGEEFATENHNHNQNQNHGEGSETGRNYVPSSSPHPPHHQHQHHQHLSVMPLRSDGSLCVSDSFTPQGIYTYIYLSFACFNNFFWFLFISTQKGIFYFSQNNLHAHKNCFFLYSFENKYFFFFFYFFNFKSLYVIFVMTEWRYENAITGGNSNEEGPKLEDFLGCYSNQNQNSTNISKINVNVSPSFCTNNNTEIETGENHHNHNHNNHNLITNQSLIHSFHHPYNNNNNNHHALINNSRMYKSWMTQTHQFSEGKSSNDGNGCSFQSLNLTMSPSVSNGVSVSVGGVGAVSNVQMNEDPRKRSLSKSGSAREPVPRKSIDTFGQRTSQYRGVTRYYVSFFFSS